MNAFNEPPSRVALASLLPLPRLWEKNRFAKRPAAAKVQRGGILFIARGRARAAPAARVARVAGASPRAAGAVRPRTRASIVAAAVSEPIMGVVATHSIESPFIESVHHASGRSAPHLSYSTSALRAGLSQ